VIKDLDNITMMYQTSAAAMGFDTFLSSIIDIYGNDKVKREEETYGNNKFTRLEVDMGIKINQYFCQKGNDVMTITFPTMGKPAETILNSLEIK